MTWIVKVDGQAHCVSCGKHITYKPSEQCVEPKHLVQYQKQQAWLVEYAKTEKGKENQRQRQARYHKNHPERIIQYRETHKDEIAEASWLRLWKYKLQTFALLGEKCIHCNETDPRLLQINHKNGGGQKEGKFGLDMYIAIVNRKRPIEDLELRCANGNILYEYEVGRRRNPPTQDELTIS